MHFRSHERHTKVYHGHLSWNCLLYSRRKISSGMQNTSMISWFISHVLLFILLIKVSPAVYCRLMLSLTVRSNMCSCAPSKGIGDHVKSSTSLKKGSPEAMWFVQVWTNPERILNQSDRLFWPDFFYISLWGPKRPQEFLLRLITPVGTMRYFQAWERCSCKEALHENTERNWTDACSES